MCKSPDSCEMMSPLSVNLRRMFDVKVIVLLCGILLQDHMCETSGPTESTWIKNILFITAKNITDNTNFPSGLVYHNQSKVKVCFNILANSRNKGCCQSNDFDCSTNVSQFGDNYSLTLNVKTLSKHDIVILKNPDSVNSCFPSNFYNSSGLILHLHRCLKKNETNIRLSEDGLCGKNVSTCEDVTSSQFEVDSGGKSCKKLSSDSQTTSAPTTELTTTGQTTTTTTTGQTTTTTTGQTTTTKGQTTTTMTTGQTTTTMTDQTTTTTTTGQTTTTTTTTGQTTTTTTTGQTTTTTTDQTTTMIDQTTTTGQITTTATSVNPEKTLTYNSSSSSPSLKEAAKIMDNMDSIVNEMGNSSAVAIKIGNISGMIAKLSPQNLGSLNFFFADSSKENNGKDFPRSITIPKEASEMAVKRNGSYVGVLIFPGMSQGPKDGPDNVLFNNEIMGIEMGAKISNLSQTIDINYSNVKKTGFDASCVSWDGKGNQSWTTDGCETVETNTSITCRCSHLTFFAILMSATPVNISASDYQALAQITETGCGVSVFFLGVALFMHFLIRRNKIVSDAVTILVNLLIAMFILNLCFLVNKTIANLNNVHGCVAIAATLHYSMLATFNWFSIQALHLYVSLHKFHAEIKHYLLKICISGWVTPAVPVVALLALKQYGNIVIHVDDGSSGNMCWIPDSAVHLGLNISYYAIVFIFTFSIFVATVTQITHFQSKAVKVHDGSSTKKRFFSILGLFCILGISWGFAFFSYGPLVIPSYYIFTILNSFQGFLLFIYYYYSTKIPPENRRVKENTNSTPTVTENIYTASPHK